MTKIDILFFPFPAYMHNRLGGFVTYSGGRCLIAIDRSQPEEVQQHCLKHEFGHIMLNHILSDDPEPEYGTPEFYARENEADEYAHNMTDAEFNVLLSMSGKKYLDTLPEGMPEQLPEVVSA
jgi:Zn-dependent peptidase ImmA (M78 family)